MEPKLLVELDLNTGESVVVEQPIDGLTNTVLESYENLAVTLEEQLEYVSAALNDDYEIVLTDPIETVYLGFKAVQLSQEETCPKLAEIYKKFSLLSAELATELCKQISH